jgi:hypothetical protein
MIIRKQNNFLINYAKRPDMSGRFFLSNSTISTTTEIITENNNNRRASYLARNYFDYAKGNECKYIYRKKSCHHDLKTQGSVPGS